MTDICKYKLLSPDSAGGGRDLLDGKSREDGLRRIQALLADWLRMENVVVLTAAGGFKGGDIFGKDDRNGASRGIGTRTIWRSNQPLNPTCVRPVRSPAEGQAVRTCPLATGNANVEGNGDRRGYRKKDFTIAYLRNRRLLLLLSTTVSKFGLPTIFQLFVFVLVFIGIFGDFLAGQNSQCETVVAKTDHFFI